MAENVPISKRLMLVNSISTIGSRLINAGVMVWVVQYLLNRLDPAQYALLPVVMGVMFIIPILTGALQQSLGRYLTEAYARSDDERFTALTSTMLMVMGAAGLGLAGLGVLVAWSVPYWLRVGSELVGDAQLMVGLVFWNIAARLAMGPFLGCMSPSVLYSTV